MISSGKSLCFVYVLNLPAENASCAVIFLLEFVRIFNLR